MKFLHRDRNWLVRIGLLVAVVTGCGENYKPQQWTIEKELANGEVNVKNYDHVEELNWTTLNLVSEKSNSHVMEFKFDEASKYGQLSFKLMDSRVKNLTMTIEIYNESTQSFEKVNKWQINELAEDSHHHEETDSHDEDHIHNTTTMMHGNFNKSLQFENETSKLRITIDGAASEAFAIFDVELEIPKEMDAETKLTQSLPPGFKTQPKGFQLVRRHQWSARAPKESIAKADWRRVVFHHTTDYIAPNSHGSCANRVRGYQRFHMNTRGWSDIGYNFIICPDGRVFEGRAGGLNARGAHASHNNSWTAGVSFIGQYDKASASSSGGLNTPTPEAREAAARLVAWIALEADIDLTKDINIPSIRSGINVTPITWHDYVMRYKKISPSRTNCAGSEIIQKMVQNGSTLELTKDYLKEYTNPGPSPSSELFCPEGSQYDSDVKFCVFNEDGSRHALGPFPEAMLKLCEDNGGGQSCRKLRDVEIEGVVIKAQRWSDSFAKSLRGNGVCPRGTTLHSPSKPFCISSDREQAYGPFGIEYVEICRQKGGGNACNMNRWSAAFANYIYSN